MIKRPVITSTVQLFPLFSSMKDGLIVDLCHSVHLQCVYLEIALLVLTFFFFFPRSGTEKVRQAQGCKHLHVVNPDWLWSCLERWERVEEQLYPLKEDYSKTPR